MPRKPKPDPEKYCLRCGKLLHRYRYGKRLEDMTRFKKRSYCSLRCANSRGIKSMDSTTQHHISNRFIQEHCASCGRSDSPKWKLHVHHINHDWTDHRMENLITLCVSCHLAIHRRKLKPCKVCGEPSRRHQMCQKHYQRFVKYGNPLMTAKRKKGTAHQSEVVLVSLMD